jgi:glycosyltransferase involved in cell wall biosynthesis
MRRNHGQTTAMAAGIEFARADVIVTMDGDLQNDPHDIRVLYEVLMNGYDIVVGWREKRRDKLITRRIPSVAANWLIARLTRTRVHDNGCTLKCFNAQLIKNIPLYSELHRFIPALASVFGARLIEVKVNHHARIHGSSKYSLSRIHKVIVDLLSVSLIVRAARWPMIWAISASIMPLAASAVIGAITLWEYWFDTPQRSLIVPTALSLLALNLGGFMFSLGLLSELIFKFAAVSPAQFPKFTMRSYERKI